MLSDVFVRFEVEDGDVIGYVFENDPDDGAEPVACICIVPPYLALESVGAFMETLAETLHFHDYYPYRNNRTFYVL